MDESLKAQGALCLPLVRKAGPDTACSYLFGAQSRSSTMSSAVVDVDTTTTLDPSAMMPHRRADRVCSLPADDSIAIEHNVYDITCMMNQLHAPSRIKGGAASLHVEAWMPHVVRRKSGWLHHTG